MKFNVILEDGKVDNGLESFSTAQRGYIVITGHEIIFYPIKLNAGDTSIRNYSRDTILSVKKGLLTHLYIYLTENRIIRLNTLSKNDIIDSLAPRERLSSRE